jgi:hypothetical protein
VPTVLYDVDLTKNDAGGGRVFGGAWEKGWLVTFSYNYKITWDCGYNIRNGSAEVTFTVSESPFANNDKTNYFGIFQHASLHQYTEFKDGNADMAYVRTGMTKYAFNKFKVCYRNMELSDRQCEKTLGATSDWKVDGKTVHTVSITWQNGTVTYNGPGGPYTYSEPRFDAIRYVYVGGCNTYKRCVKGQKFLSLKVTDLDNTVGIAPAVIDNRKRPAGYGALFDLLGKRIIGDRRCGPGIYFTVPGEYGSAELRSRVIVHPY